MVNINAGRKIGLRIPHTVYTRNTPTKATSDMFEYIINAFREREKKKKVKSREHCRTEKNHRPVQYAQFPEN